MPTPAPNFKPDKFHTITPYIILDDSAKAIDWYTKAFGAKEIMRMPGPGGRIMHAEMLIGDSVVMFNDPFPDMGAKSPSMLGGSAGSLMMYVPDVDATFQRAVEAGAKPLMPPADMFWGDRFGKLMDPFGHMWSIATYKTVLTEEEMSEAARNAFAQGSAAD